MGGDSIIFTVKGNFTFYMVVIVSSSCIFGDLALYIYLLLTAILRAPVSKSTIVREASTSIF